MKNILAIQSHVVFGHAHNPKKKKGVVSHALVVFFYFQQTRQ
jgi:hypothetical protein